MISRSSGDYTRWAAWLEDFGRGIDTDPTDLPPFDTAWGEGMYGRLLDRVEQAFASRMGLWDRQLARDLGEGGLTADRLGAAMAAARRRLLPVQRLAALPHFPGDLRTALAEAMRSGVESAQRSLERSAAAADRTGRAAAVVRGATLLADLAGPASPPGAPPNDDPHAGGPARRIRFR